MEKDQVIEMIKEVVIFDIGESLKKAILDERERYAKETCFKLIEYFSKTGYDFSCSPLMDIKEIEETYTDFYLNT